MINYKIMEPTINSHVLQMTGKCELPEPVSIGHNYTVTLKGSVTSQRESDNDDGTHNMTYTFKPVTGEVLTEDGASLKLKDNRSNSQLMRALLYKIWLNAASSEPFEDFYDRMCMGMMRDMNELVDKYGQK